MVTDEVAEVIFSVSAIKPTKVVISVCSALSATILNRPLTSLTTALPFSGAFITAPGMGEFPLALNTLPEIVCWANPKNGKPIAHSTTKIFLIQKVVFG
jgi:hypothetical protein